MKVSSGHAGGGESWSRGNKFVPFVALLSVHFYCAILYLTQFVRQIRPAVLAEESVNYWAILICSVSNLMLTGVTLTARDSIGLQCGCIQP